MSKVINILKSKFLWLNILGAILVAALAFYILQVSLKSYTCLGCSVTVPNLVRFTKDEAIEKLEKLKLDYVITDSVYREKMEPGAIVEQNPDAYSKVKEARTIYLKINRMQVPMVTLPDVSDGNLDKRVFIDLYRDSLKMGSTDYQSYPDENIVLGFTLNGEKVEAGTKVKMGTEIGLIVGDGQSDRKVITPNYIGKTLSELEFKMTWDNLNLGMVIFDKTVEDSATAVVYMQDPDYNSGYQLDFGEAVDVYFTQILPDSLLSSYNDSSNIYVPDSIILDN